MARILTSVRGRSLGLDDRRRLMAPAGFVAGEHGSQIALPAPGAVTFFDDFLGDLVADEWNFVEGTDAATSSAAILAGGIGGVLRMTTGDAGTGIAADMEQANLGLLQWQASNGGLSFETRVKLSQITDCYVFLGFTDVATLEAPIVSAASADDLTTTASDAVGFLFDTRMATDVWWLAGVAGDLDAIKQNSGFAPVAATYETFRIEVTTAGVAVFFRNGRQVGAAMSGALTPATDLTPTLCVSKVATASTMTMDVDYVHVAMNR